MKILMTLFDIQDYGGIINHAENLAMGLKEIGHEVDFVKLCPKKKFGSTRAVSAESIAEYRKLGTGLFYHQSKGWWWPNENKVAYLDDVARAKFVEKCADYDAVLWHIPVPTCNKDNAGVNEWLQLYNPDTKNIAIIHDGNMPELYPHLNYVAHYFHGMVCVHESAYHSASCIGIPRKMIVNPFDLFGIERQYPDFHNRSGFTAVQVFKAWKRVDDLIRAIPHMKNKENKVVGGAGIEYRYMTSQDKCKPKYFDEAGDRIWDKALRHGMNYVGTIPTDVHYQLLRKSKLQIDPSWSRKYSAFGAHFNRTSVEAILCGAVPVATNLGMNKSQVFKAGVNYIELEVGAESQHHYAEVIDDALNDEIRWRDIVINNYSLAKRFDRKQVAQEYIDFINDKTLGETGKETTELIDAMLNKLDFFGIWQARMGYIV
jgi:hypothetical protein